MSNGIRVTALDHIVLVASDVERCLDWYLRALGCPPVRVEEWRRGEVPFPSFRISDDTIIDVLGGDRSAAGVLNVDHLCLVIEPTDLAALASSGRCAVVDGPGRRYGARGDGTSLYVRDPDGNVAGLAVVASAWAMIGVMVGGLVRHQVPAAVGSIIWVLVVENLAAGFLGDAGRFLPGQAAHALADASAAGNLLPAWAAAAILTGYLAVLAPAAALSLSRRELLLTT